MIHCYKEVYKEEKRHSSQLSLDLFYGKISNYSKITGVKIAPVLVTVPATEKKGLRG